MGLEPELRARLEDWLDRAERTWQVVVSDMLSPPEALAVQVYCQRLSTMQCCAWGGYPQAERVRVAVAPADLPLSPRDVPLTLLNVAGNFLFDPASHRDFLGAMVGSGLVREKVGDILVLGERGAQAIVLPELAEFLCTQVTQVRSVPVTVSVLDWAELRVPEPRTKNLTTVEASLRLDALGSAGFSLSRAKMADWIKQGEVRVNWQTITQPSYALKSGDAIVIRGKGRVVVGEINLTKKDRYRVDLTRFS
ncbi:RNA-binding S4 [Gloeomargarita lithophora Alchichica-D10]|uniref:RNA-binding S4 n=1 Tax=Gloeomargarita lithophora Alchichica-D10 TaxID=1188229 RepID=A0A1J0AAU5_9CYAN|nr:photosystem II S4 domain protein [Gloeomargarita lithophora]APB33050.1 RNA-binding S4 [Gloeomargarita lithophora Alchichica-D10]